MSVDLLEIGCFRQLKTPGEFTVAPLGTHILPVFFLLVTPENSTGLHLKLLARISRILKNEPFKERLLNAADKDEIFSIIEEEDEEF